MGVVDLARDPKLGRDVAVKVVPPQFSADKERLARFEQEARGGRSEPPEHPLCPRRGDRTGQPLSRLRTPGRRDPARVAAGRAAPPAQGAGLRLALSHAGDNHGLTESNGPVLRDLRDACVN
jgi:hypothetical protein